MNWMKKSWPKGSSSSPIGTQRDWKYLYILPSAKQNIDWNLPTGEIQLCVVLFYSKTGTPPKFKFNMAPEKLPSQ